MVLASSKLNYRQTQSHIGALHTFASKTHQKITVVRRNFTVQKLLGIIMVLVVCGADVNTVVINSRQSGRIICNKTQQLNERTHEWPTDQSNERTNDQQNKWTNDQPNKRTNERPAIRTKERTTCQTNERTVKNTPSRLNPVARFFSYSCKTPWTLVKLKGKKRTNVRTYLPRQLPAQKQEFPPNALGACSRPTGQSWNQDAERNGGGKQSGRIVMLRRQLKPSSHPNKETNKRHLL